jgi:hypothetical protein
MTFVKLFNGVLMVFLLNSIIIGNLFKIVFDYK